MEESECLTELMCQPLWTSAAQIISYNYNLTCIQFALVILQSKWSDFKITQIANADPKKGRREKGDNMAFFPKFLIWIKWDCEYMYISKQDAY